VIVAVGCRSVQTGCDLTRPTRTGPPLVRVADSEYDRVWQMQHLTGTAYIRPARTASAFLGDGERWYVVHTLPSCELRAEANLRNQEFRTFLPRRHKTIRHARKLRTVEAPFFPGYLFLILDLARQQWRRVNSTFGVSRLVMQGDQPHPVPCGIVEALFAAADSRDILRLGEHLKVGSPVRLMAGPFAEQLAVLDSMDDSARVRVLLEVLGRKVAISTWSDNILPLV
jgi:transcription elongation factor/antiterminator RfaH